MPSARVGIIGGSGLYAIEGLGDVETCHIETPYGPTSDELTLGTLGGVRAAFLPRHGRGHRLSPSELPAQANIWAFKSLGVTHVISISAVGSLRAEIAPRDVVIPDQILDRTKGIRPASYFGGGIVAHIAFGEPYCPELRRVMIETAQAVGARTHDGGTMVVMEGPQFSTKAESNFYRQIGGTLIGMTALPEAKLAREAELCYATVAMVTDYDCWHESEEAVTVDMVIANLLANVDKAKAIVREAVPKIAELPRDCDCPSALQGALITQAGAMSAARAKELDWLIGKYL